MTNRAFTNCAALAIFSLSLMTQACVTDTQSLLEADIVIRNVTVIDAANGARPDKTVVIKGRQIVAVNDSNTIKYSATHEIEADGKFLIPGLWDAHVHLRYDSKISSDMPRLFLANGITSVRDTGGNLELLLEAREQSKKHLSPSVYIAGPLIDGEPTVYAEPTNDYPAIGRTVSTPEQATAEVDRLAAAGVDLIKAYEMLSPRSFKAVLARAKEHNLPVTGHVPLSMTAVQAAKAGLNSIEHMRNLQMDCSTNAEALFKQRQTMLRNADGKSGAKLRSEIHAAQHFDAVRTYDRELCAKLLAELARHETWQVPTMTLNMLFKTPYYGDPEWQKTFDYLSADLAADWRRRGSEIAKRLTAESPLRQKRLQVSDWQIQMFGQIVDADIPVMAGTDTPLLYLTPGFSLHLELQNLVTYGMSPLQAIEAATLTPAKFFRLDKSQGTIATGMLADLVLLNANPTSDIRNTTKINAVVKDGRLLDRNKLDQLLNPAYKMDAEKQKSIAH